MDSKPPLSSEKLIVVVFFLLLFSVLISGAVGFFAGQLAWQYNQNSQTTSAKSEKTNVTTYQPESTKPVTVPTPVPVVTQHLTNHDAPVVQTVKNASPAVVSIIVSKDLPIVERHLITPFGGAGGFVIPYYRQNGSEKRQVGGGSGFIISQDGYIVTNKHVVDDTTAEYTVILNDERSFATKVLARDPHNDIAILKIDGANLPTLQLGDSDTLEPGQSVIAIGNALGEFRNTISTGVVSGLARSITASQAGQMSEQLLGLIQTDASINPGNSGGPLLTLSGEVIGINTAIVQSAQNIGFAIPINSVKTIIASVKQYGKIIKPWLGVRYFQLNKLVAKKYNLATDYGALITTQSGQSIAPGSPAEKAGLKEGDVLLEINGKKLTNDYPLFYAISFFQANETITIKVLREGKTFDMAVTLDNVTY